MDRNTDLRVVYFQPDPVVVEAEAIARRADRRLERRELCRDALRALIPLGPSVVLLGAAIELWGLAPVLGLPYPHNVETASVERFLGFVRNLWLLWVLLATLVAFPYPMRMARGFIRGLTVMFLLTPTLVVGLYWSLHGLVPVS